MSFIKQVLIALGSLAVLASYPLVKLSDSNVIIAVIIGAILATVNVLIGYAAIEYSFNKSATTLMMAVLGGMGVRMFGILIILLILIKVLKIELVPLLCSFGACYIVFLILEVIYINKKVHLRQQ